MNISRAIDKLDVSSLFRSPGHSGQHCVLFAAAQASGARGRRADGAPQHRRPRGARLPAWYAATLPLETYFPVVRTSDRTFWPLFQHFLSTGVDLIATFYGCLYAGCVPVTVRPPHPQNLATTLPTVKMIVEVTFSVAAQLLLSLYGSSSCVDDVAFFSRFAGQQVGLHPDHAGHHEAAEIQRGRCRRGHQELAHGAGHW